MYGKEYDKSNRDNSNLWQCQICPLGNKKRSESNVKDIEICIICDGSPDAMVSFFEDMGKDDPRMKVFVFPKSPRTGEPYRDKVIEQTSGKIICYCSHDDLWLPDHIQVMEKSLRNGCFTHTLHAMVNPSVKNADTSNWLRDVGWINLNPEIMKKMKSGENWIGLTFGAAHQRFLLSITGTVGNNPG